MSGILMDFGRNSLAAGAVGSGITWLSSRLISSVTKPLVGGAVAGGALLVSYVASEVFGRLVGLSKNSKGLIFIASIFISPIGLAMAATALGYSVSISIPLSLLLSVSNIVTLMVIN